MYPETIDFYNQNAEELTAQYLQADRSELQTILRRWILPAFPLKPDHPLLKEQFDAVVCIATLMHIPDHEFFDFAYQIRTLLKNQGIFLCSFSQNRKLRHNDQRLYIDRDPDEIFLLFERLGFRLLKTEENHDGMDRELNWITLIFGFGGELDSRPIDQIKSIINRD